jgi:hypothetical protein
MMSSGFAISFCVSIGIRSRAGPPARTAPDCTDRFSHRQKESPTRRQAGLKVGVSSNARPQGEPEAVPRSNRAALPAVPRVVLLCNVGLVRVGRCCPAADPRGSPTVACFTRVDPECNRLPRFNNWACGVARCPAPRSHPSPALLVSPIEGPQARPRGEVGQAEWAERLSGFCSGFVVG